MPCFAEFTVKLLSLSTASGLMSVSTEDLGLRTGYVIYYHCSMEHIT
jgi:hypothetical protein